MDPQYRDIFQLLYKQEPEPRYWVAQAPPLVDDSSVLHRTIDNVDEELFRSRRRRIRADAKYFLYVNFMEMVFLPIRIRGRYPEELITSLRADLELVVNDAARLQEVRERRQGSGSEALSPFEPELSGHSVLESVALNWRNLKLSDLRIWGED
jgi:hypothetical protein